MFRADIAVSKGLGLDGGRVRILVSNMPFRILQQVLTAYEKAQDQATKSGASGPLVGSLKLFWRMALPYPGLDEAADLVQSALGVGDDDTDVAANFVVTSLAAESVTVGYGLVIEGVDQAWHTLNTVRLEAPKVIKSAADVTALCKALKIETGPGKPSADLLGAAMTAITGLGGGADSGEGGDSSGGGEAAITEKERLLDRLSDLQTAITDEGKAFLASNQPMVQAIFSRMAEANAAQGGGPAPQILRAMENLKMAIRFRLAQGPLNETQIHGIAAALDRAAQEVERA